MRIREFSKFPKGITCPICQTDKNEPCILVQLDGTNSDNIVEAKPVHSDCIKMLPFQYSSDLDLLYVRTPKNQRELWLE